jgi:quinol monooxygenase YgiN
VAIGDALGPRVASCMTRGVREARSSFVTGGPAELRLRPCCPASAVAADLVIAFGHNEPSRARETTDKAATPRRDLLSSSSSGHVAATARYAKLRTTDRAMPRLNALALALRPPLRPRLPNGRAHHGHPARTRHRSSRRRDRWLAILEAVTPPSRAEDACHSYVLYEAIEAPNTFIFVEEWTGLDGLYAHFQTPHFTEFFARSERCSPGRPSGLSPRCLQHNAR